jgi:biotin transport system substrate-specific component
MSATPHASSPPAGSHSGVNTALIAVFAAVIVVFSVLPAIPIGPVGVPITLQTFAVILTGAVLGPKRGALAVLLYLTLGAIGLPVFAGGTGGLARFMGPTAGYLIAFPLVAALCGAIVVRLPRSLSSVKATVCVFCAGFGSSIVLVHTLGPLGMAVFGDLSLTAAFTADLVFYPGDIVKNILMALTATTIHRAFPNLLARPQRVRS